MPLWKIAYTPNNPIDGKTEGHIRTRDKTVLDTVNATTTTTGGGPLFEASETRRRFGLRPRGVWLGVKDSTYGTIKKRRFVPVVTEARFDAINLGDTFTIAGTTWVVIRKDEEEVGV